MRNDDSNHYLTHIVTKEESGRQVKFLLTHVLGLTAAKIRSVKFDHEGIFLNDERVPVTQVVREGQILRILLNDSEWKDEHLIPVPMELSILYEDEDLLILDKPAGIVCHPSKGHLTDSLANGVLHYFQAKHERSNIHLIGRLDKDTSGVVTVAKNGVTAERLATQRENGTWFKTYYCIVQGIPPQSGTISTPMDSYQTDDGLLKMGEGTLSAVTHYEVIRQIDTVVSLCRVHIETGRTHQIRFHLASIGHPLLGDALYGEPSALISRAALHAECVRFIHPYTGEEIVLHANLPEDFKSLLSE